MKMQNGMATFEDNLPVYYKINHTLLIWSYDLVIWYLSEYTENLHPHKNLPMFTVLFVIAKA